MREVKLEKDLNLLKDFNVPDYDEWKENVIRDLNGADFDKKLITNTYEGIPLKPLYIKEDTEVLKFKNAYPGFKKYNRGFKASGDVKNHWLISTKFNYGLAEEFNEAVQYDLPRGLEAIVLNLDKLTELNKNCDSAARYEVGNGGVSISDGESFSKALDNLKLAEVPVFIEAGISPLPMSLIYLSYLKQQKLSTELVHGGITADPVEFLLKYGFIPTGVNNILDEISVATNLFAKNLNFKTIGVSSAAINNAGGSAVQELAYSLATAVYYIESLLDRGISAEALCNKMKFKFGVGAFYFMEIAKLRAFKMLWSNIAKEYGIDSTAFIHVQTTQLNHTKFDSHVNMLRTTTEAFSAILGGVDLLETIPFNDVLGQSNEFGRRIARNTQIILREESHLNKLIDPAGGSFFIESLTNQLAEKSWEMFQHIQKQGGIVKAIQSGYLQKEVHNTFQLRKKDLAKRKGILVGTNMYANPKEEAPKENAPDYEKLFSVRKKQLHEFLKEHKAERNSVLEKLNAIKTPMDIDEYVIDEKLLFATIEDIAEALRKTAEKGFKVEALSFNRLATDFENIRMQANRIGEGRGKKPEVFLINFGSLAEYKARADYSRGFFEVGGFKVTYPKGFDNCDEAAASAINSNADIAVICSTDDNYAEVATKIALKIKSVDNNMRIILAGNPKDKRDEYADGGVDDFIYIGVDALELLQKLLNSIENKQGNK